MFAASIIFINLALVLYTIGVWGEKRSGTIKRGHLIFFGMGLVADMTGTTLMSVMASEGSNNIWHAVTGGAALVLMLVHAAWAAWVYWKGNDHAKRSFHKFSLLVWGFWLIPYAIGAIMGMTG